MRRTIGSLSAVMVRDSLTPEGKVELCISAETPRQDGDSPFMSHEPIYGLSVAVGDGMSRRLAEAEMRYLATEVAGGFTGVYLAMYATGNGRPCQTPADFASFTYRPVLPEV